MDAPSLQQTLEPEEKNDFCSVIHQCYTGSENCKSIQNKESPNQQCESEKTNINTEPNLCDWKRKTESSRSDNLLEIRGSQN